MRLRGAALDTGALADDFRVRFQQTCGPVMAKGIEDTAYYRWLRLAGANEVGGHPDHLSITADEFHAWCERLVVDVADVDDDSHDPRHEALGGRAGPAHVARRGRRRAGPGGSSRPARSATPTAPTLVDGPTEYLLWQTLVGAWPITGSRLEDYLLKAVREAKVHTAWVDGDAAYEDAVTDYARALTRDPAVQQHLDAWTVAHEPSVRANVLAQKLIQLTMPGVPDVYQGCEIVALSLVDPDNRRPVDWTDREERLARVVADEPALDLDDDKLRLDRPGPRGCVATTPPPSSARARRTPGCAPTSEHALAFARGDADGVRVVTVVTIGAGLLAAGGGFGDAVVDAAAGVVARRAGRRRRAWSPVGRCRWRRCWRTVRSPCWCGPRDRFAPSGCRAAADRGLGPAGRAGRRSSGPSPSRSRRGRPASRDRCRPIGHVPQDSRARRR